VVGFALFGAGRIGVMHAANIAANPRARLHCIYDVQTAFAEKAAAAHGAKVAPTVEAALADPAVDAVLIASSTDTHVTLITAAARAGKAILCEKPIHLDIARVEQCKRDIAGTNVPIQLGFNRRFDPSFRAVQQGVERGDIGQLQLLVITSRDPGIAPMEYMKVSGGIFRDMMIHDFDLARYVLGEDPAEVFAAGSVMIEPALAGINDVDTAMVVMKAPSGALVHINNSRRAVYGYDQRLEAFGSAGMLQADNWRHTTVRRATAETTEAQDPLLHFFIQRYTQAYTDELNAFIDAVEKKQPTPVDFEDGRKALLLADAAWESLRSGRSIKVQY
jgi:myo-inositol 2-dehydrogenase / D-chiro-inositol 1-dehydrogenase